MDLHIAGRVAIVTGASRGLGAAMAAALATEGAMVAATVRTEADGHNLTRRLGARVVAYVCDMTRHDEVALLPDRVAADLGRLDVLVNNAGIAPAAHFAAEPLSAWTEVLAVNLLGPVALIKGALPHFLAQGGGKVVNIASTSGLRGKASLAAYSASKGAMLRMTEALAGELAQHNVQVNAIAPGAFRTDAQRVVLGDEALHKRRIARIPARRMGETEEIGPLVCYLASPTSAFVTGATFVIDGGESSKL